MVQQMPIQFLGFCWGFHLSTARAVSTFHFLTARAVSFTLLSFLHRFPPVNHSSWWTGCLNAQTDWFVQTSLLERKTARSLATRAATWRFVPFTCLTSPDAAKWQEAIVNWGATSAATYLGWFVDFYSHCKNYR